MSKLPSRISSTFWMGIGVTVIAALVHAQKGLDFWVQGHLYRNGEWLVTPAHRDLYEVFYIGARRMPWVVGGLVVFGAIYRFFRSRVRPQAGEIQAIGFIAALPILANFLKSVTAQACPDEFQAFGGPLPDWLLFHGGSRCFPGGHVTSGLGLLGISFLLRDPRRRRLARVVVGAWSATIGFFQMARGVHFLSDTIASAGLAMILFSLSEGLGVKGGLRRQRP